jgi:predicted nucleic acid-binding protein
MSGRCFVDTNVLVYARDASEVEKQARAQEWLEPLWRRRSGRTSFQVLSEFYVTVTQKLSPGMAPEEARRDVRNLLVWQPQPLDAARTGPS